MALLALAGASIILQDYVRASVIAPAALTTSLVVMLGFSTLQGQSIISLGQRQDFVIPRGVIIHLSEVPPGHVILSALIISSLVA